MKDYYQKLFRQLADQGTRSSVSGLQIANAPLRRRVSAHLSRSMGEPGSLLGDPVFEATYPWQAAPQTMQQLAGGLLHSKLVAALDKPPKALWEEYRFPQERHPYNHQLQAWKHLSGTSLDSLVVTSGTGSGKTECFLIPILDDLARELEEQGTAPIEGVRALFLYPLNALINSQKDRLDAWTAAFNGGIRYCLYNGLTPERPDRSIEQVPQAVGSRHQLRASPPPILVTNATMLEYMLVRVQDQPILEKSQGNLRWIVLDEAHTYLGSQAAELALLLRRVMHGFGVKADQVRFVATSATIGDEDSRERLREFLARMAGIPDDRVIVLDGERQIPILPQVPAELRGMKPSAIAAIEPEQTESERRYLALAGSPELTALRAMIANPGSGKPVAALSQIARRLFGDLDRAPDWQYKVLAMLDLCSGTTRSNSNNDGVESFLPLRAHAFGRTVGGLWACINRDCPHRSDELKDAEWGFGEVYFTRREHCDCGAPVFDLVSCNECNSVHLLAEEDRNGRIRSLSESDDIDEFARELDPVDEEELQVFADGQTDWDGRVILTAGSYEHTQDELLDRDGCRVPLGSEGFPTHLYLQDDGMRCPVCETRERHRNALFMRKILGAPFHLAVTLPTLLEFSPPLRDGHQHPWEGRRMITFTDSRQCTARTAANLQLDAERNFLRSHVYHTLLAAAGGGDSDELRQARETLEQIEEQLSSPNVTEPMLGILESSRIQFQQKLIEAAGPASLSWDQMARTLAGNSQLHWIGDHYCDLDNRDFGGDRGVQNLSHMLLAREFLRRPKRQNSLESMGLVQVWYPNLQSDLNRVPGLARGMGFELPEWRDFLKLLLDWHVRAAQAVVHEPYWRRWIGNRFPFKRLVAPSQMGAVRGVVLWPAVKGTRDYSRFVRLLREAFKVDPSTAAGKDRIDAVMQEAWEDLRKLGLVKPVEEGLFALDLTTRLAFRLLEQGWVCPITRRILDTTLKSITPFLPPQTHGSAIRCEAVSIPVAPVAFEVERNRAWLGEDPGVALLRDLGLWTGPHDRVIQNSRYFAAAEHSAQQPAWRLRGFERSFKRGNLNLLSCSTTMEMGVDIGGISVVAMNNAPPNPANYLQRAGRCGRRGETRALSYTLCKDNPHGHHVIRNTRWPFDTPIPLPSISLESPSIVQRHVNSLLLGEFLKELTANSDLNLLRQNCDWFFWAEDPNDAPALQMLEWCRYLPRDERIESALRHLVRQSVLEGRSSRQLCTETADRLKLVIARWRRELDALQKQLQDLQLAGRDQDTSRAIKVVEIAIHRLKIEYLLGELVTQGFLPGYGFPHGVVSLNTLTAEQLNREERSRGEANSDREDNRQRYRNFPSRSRSTAIREYAPGAEVVIDGVVYRSEGISLTWQKPMSESQVKEPQGFFHTWNCGQCGAAGISMSRAQAEHCGQCGASIKPGEIRQAMEPNGFSVDIGWETHNDISRPQYLPVTPPQVTARGEWIPLLQERLGRFRATEVGQVLFANHGSNGQGYAICLECGRAADMPHSGDRPELFKKPHKRLRGGRIDGSRLCSGSDESWKVKPSIHLVHRDNTDVFELQLKNLETRAFLDDAIVATTLAVALRHGAALVLGINDDELGYAVSHVEVAGGRTWSILNYDTADGGAGYASSIGRHILRVAQAMYHGLNCEANCDTACHQCLLTFDTQHQVKLLDRRRALEWLTEAFPRLLELPTDMRLLGPVSGLETEPVYKALDRALQSTAAKGVRLFLGGEPQRWDSALGELRHRILTWRARDLAVELVVYRDTFSGLDDEIKGLLATLAQGLDLLLSTVAETVRPGGGIVVAEAIAEGITRWACEDTQVILVGEDWGRVTEKPLIIAHGLTDPIATEPITKEWLGLVVSTDDLEIEINDELHGPGEGFGERYWDHVLARHKGLKQLFEHDQLESIRYSDRYLRTPLGVALLLLVLYALDKRYPNCYGRSVVNIRLEDTREDHFSYQRMVWDDWTEDKKREGAIEQAFEYVDLGIKVGTYSRQHMPHFRILELIFESGKSARIRLDEGWGYWEAQGGYPSHFDFDAGAMEQGQAIAEWSGNLVQKKKTYPTALVLSIR